MDKPSHNLPFSEFKDFSDWFEEIMALAVSDGFGVNVTDPENFRQFYDKMMSPWDALSEAERLGTFDSISA